MRKTLKRLGGAAVLLLLALLLIPCGKAMAWEVWPYHIENVTLQGTVDQEINLYAGDVYQDKMQMNSNGTPGSYFKEWPFAVVPQKGHVVGFSALKNNPTRGYLSIININHPGNGGSGQNLAISGDGNSIYLVCPAGYQLTDMAWVIKCFDESCVDSYYINSDGYWLIKFKDVNGDGCGDILFRGYENGYSGSNVQYILYSLANKSTTATRDTNITLLYEPPTFAGGNTQAGAARIAAEAARIAAENTVAYAQQAASNSSNAYSAASSANSNASTAASNTAYGGASAAYWSYYGYYKAIDAQTAGNNATTAANNAANIAQNALTAGNNATSKANDVLNQVNNGSYGLNSISNKVSNISSQVTNIQNSIAPQITKVIGVGGATCSRPGGSFSFLVDASGATQYCYSIDGGAFSAWQTLNAFTVTLAAGSHTITVKAKNTGVEAQASMIAFGL